MKKIQKIIVKAAALYVAVLKDKKGEIHMDYFLGKEPGFPSLPYACINDEKLHQYLKLLRIGIIPFLTLTWLSLQFSFKSNQ